MTPDCLFRLRLIGNYGSVEFDDPVIHSVIEAMGGWVQFQNVHVNEWKWRRTEFERLYAVKEKLKDHPTYCPGLFEIQNGARGFSDFE